jgi:hypothetical protein
MMMSFVSEQDAPPPLTGEHFGKGCNYDYWWASGFD